MNKIFLSGLFVSLFFCQMPFTGQSQINSNPAFGVSAVQYGLWSAVNNPAGMSMETGFSAGFYYQSAFLMHELADAGFSASIPLAKLSVVGLGYRQFGYSLYKEQKAGLTFSKQLGNSVSAGIRFDYLSIQFGNEYGKSSLFTGTAGAIVKITDELRMGVYVFNPQRVNYSKKSQVRLPAKISVGATWRFGSHVELSLGAEKESEIKEKVTCGLDYAISRKFKLYAGAGTDNYPFYFGYHFRIGHIEIGMGSGYHHLLGFSPQFLLTYKKD